MALFTAPLQPAPPQAVPGYDPVTGRWLSPQERRRLNFIRIERLSQSEAADLPSTFDPGMEFDP